MPIKHCRVLAGKQKTVEGRPEGEMERLPQSKPKVAGLHSEEAKGAGPGDPGSGFWCARQGPGVVMPLTEPSPVLSSFPQGPRLSPTIL